MELNKRWYIYRRGELLAEQFLLELEPLQLTYTGDQGVFDFILIFSKPNGSPVTIAVEVKATEKVVGAKFPINVRQLKKLSDSNIPVLIIVIDVKSNDIYYTWISDVMISDDNSRQLMPIKLRPATSDEIPQLKQEILSK